MLLFKQCKAVSIVWTCQPWQRFQLYKQFIAPCYLHLWLYFFVRKPSHIMDKPKERPKSRKNFECTLARKTKKNRLTLNVALTLILLHRMAWKAGLSGPHWSLIGLFSWGNCHTMSYFVRLLIKYHQTEEIFLKERKEKSPSLVIFFS